MIFKLWRLDELFTVWTLGDHFAEALDVVLHYSWLLKVFVLLLAVPAGIYDVVLTVRAWLQRDPETFGQVVVAASFALCILALY